VAVAVNVGVAVLALVIASTALHPSAGEVQVEHEPAIDADAAVQPAAGAGVVYVAIAFSGLCALASEVIWTRTLGLLFGASVYTFSIILAVFLVGLGIGSSVGSLLARTSENPRLLFGWCQMFAALSVAWGAYVLAVSLPYWPVNPSISSNIWYNFQLDLVRAFWTLLPAALFWGASFPLALASVVTRGQDPGRLVGGVYAANTLGAIVGSLGASLLLVAWLGSQRAQQLLVALSAISGLLLLTQTVDRSPAARFKSLGFVGLLLVAGIAGLAIRYVPPMSELLVAYGRYSATWVNQSEIIYMGEGVNSSVAVSRVRSGVLNYHNAGKIQASSEPQDMRLQRMLGHFTTLMPRNARSVVVIGCGAGVTAGAVSIDPRVERVTIAEIEPLVPEVVSTHFAEHNFNVVKNPKVQIRIDDARHFILTSKEKFDAITSDPLDPWVKGAATLYTKEFFEAVRDHLNPGGVVTLFVQLYESNPAAVKSEVATFLEVFPNGAIWGNTHQGRGYDMVLLGQVEPLKIDIDEIQARLNRPEYAPVAQSLRQIGINSAVDLFATYAGRRPDLDPWMKDAVINRDRNLRLQYLAGMGLNLYENGVIYDDILNHRRFPADMFTGSEASLQMLRNSLQRIGN
jgi:spermidine synthase